MLFWYVVQVRSGYEKRVKAQLEENIRISELQKNFGRVLVPIESLVEMRAGQKRKSERKYFPGYVFIEADLISDAWRLIRSVPYVLAVIGSKEKPNRLNEQEVKRLLALIEEGQAKTEPKFKKAYQVGEIVRVLEGPFNDFTGAVEEINYEKSRLKVAISVFGRSTPVELEFSQVEKEM